MHVSLSVEVYLNESVSVVNIILHIVMWNFSCF